MATPTSSPPTTATTLTPPSTSISTFSAIKSFIPAPVPASTAENIDYRVPAPPGLDDISSWLYGLQYSLYFAIKMAKYISHRTLFALFNRQKNKDNAALKQQFIDVLSQFLNDEELNVEEFEKIFSCFAEKNKNRSKAFVMEVARCEGVREYIQYECYRGIIDNGKLLDDNIFNPLIHAQARMKVQKYIQLISETHEIHQKTVKAFKESKMRLKELVELANKRLAAIPEGGEPWDDDYEAFALTKSAARKEFAESLGM